MHKEMPKINACDVINCVYNKERHCNTIAITVGHQGGCAGCDTAAFASQKAGVPYTDGEVGDCRQTDCQFNNSWECNAKMGIEVGMHENHPDCRTYKPGK